MDVQNILLFVVSVLTILMAFFVLRGQTALSSKAFSIYAVFISLWSIGLALFRLTDNIYYLQSLEKFYYLAALGIALSFLYFSIYFPNEKRLNVEKHILINIIPFIISIFILFKNDFLIKQTYISLNNEKTVDIAYSGYILYLIYFVVYIILSYVFLLNSYKAQKDKLIRKQLKIIILGTILPFILASYFNLFLPITNYNYIWAGPLFAFIVTAAILYAIFKHHLFNIKVVVTEALLSLLWLFILIRTFLEDSYEDKLTNFTLLGLTIIIGILVIRSVKNEVESREHIEFLAQDLERANSDLQNANEKLKELDQMKSEFVSLATHQIRAPLTAIKGYISLIQEGDYGPVTPEVKSAINVIFQSTNNLVTIVGDFLDVSRIEQGKMQYDFKLFDVQELTQQVVTELKPNLEKKGLKHTYSYDKDQNYKIYADQGKIKQVVGNIVDNSIKYTPHGLIAISITKPEQNLVRIKISDTGVGIPKKVLPKLFQKFTRAENANDVNILGTGLGLYVARQMIEAHQGKIWAESEGDGKGSQFYIELPMQSKLPENSA